MHVQRPHGVRVTTLRCGLVVAFSCGLVPKRSARPGGCLIPSTGLFRKYLCAITCGNGGPSACSVLFQWRALSFQCGGTQTRSASLLHVGMAAECCSGSTCVAKECRLACSVFFRESVCPGRAAICSTAPGGGRSPRPRVMVLCCVIWPSRCAIGTMLVVMCV